MYDIRHEVWTGADPESVFTAIATKAGLNRWWGPVISAEAAKDAKVAFDHGLGEPLRMRVAEMTRPERLTWICLSDYQDPSMPGSEWLGHRITFALRTGQDEPGTAWLRPRLALNGQDFTILEFSHSGWRHDSRWRAFCNTTWGRLTLDGLKRACETPT